MMDEQTALVLALQLVALFSIAGALLVYLLCKIRASPEPEAGLASIGGGKSVLVTSCDTAIGLQLALHLSERGFRVFAGMRDGAASGSDSDSVPARVIRAWQKSREGNEAAAPAHGNIVGLPLDVTREDMLHEAVDIIRAHLPAGEDGVWAVINTSGLSYRGRLDQQESTHWDAILKTNVVGLLRTARTFQGLLRNTKGRLITLGVSDATECLSVACTASRHAVRGASEALAHEFAPAGIKVINLNPKGIGADVLFCSPKLQRNQNNEISLDMTGCLEFQPKVFTGSALQDLELALTCRDPKQSYTLNQTTSWTKRLGVLQNM